MDLAVADDATGWPAMQKFFIPLGFDKKQVPIHHFKTAQSVIIWFLSFSNRIAVYCNGSNHFKTAHSVSKWLNLLFQSYFCLAQVLNGLKSFGWAKSTDQLNFRLLSKLGTDMKNNLCHAFRKIPDVLHVLWEQLQKGKDAEAVTGDGATDELSEWSEDGADRTTRPQDDTTPTFGGGVTWQD